MRKYLKIMFHPSSQTKIRKKIQQVIEIEQRFLLEEFSPEYLENELGIDKEILMKMINQLYGQSFYELLRYLRINHLKSLVSQYEDKLPLSQYSKFTGFKTVEVMLRSLKDETGLDFDDFCKYSIDSTNRKKNNLS